MAAIGFALADILNESKKVRFALSPVYLSIVAFCFSMTIGVIWEFFEYGMDRVFGLDMQKDTIINGYRDIGLIDTMNDLLVNFAGAVVFSLIGYFYVKSRGKGKFAGGLIPRRKAKEADFLGQAEEEENDQEKLSIK